MVVEDINIVLDHHQLAADTVATDHKVLYTWMLDRGVTLELGQFVFLGVINFPMFPGNCGTIITFKFREYHKKIPPQVAGLLLSAIISDTLNLQSTTTTPYDEVLLCSSASLFS